MPIYRSDQAQLTFAAEAAPGGSPEMAMLAQLTSSAVLINATAGIPAGTRSIPVDGMANTSEIPAGTFVAIGPTISGGSTLTFNSEIAKVAFVESTTSILLETPTAFFHPDNTDIKTLSDQTTLVENDQSKLIKYVPGVYEAIEVPDPEMAIEPRYYLGSGSKRNFFEAYSGQQTYTGSLGGFILLDGRPLRFPIGKVVTVPYAANDTTQAVTAGSAQLSGAVKKGDMHVLLDAGHGVDTGDDRYFVIYSSSSSTTTDAALAEAEVCEAVSIVNTNYIRLNSPLLYDHIDNANIRRVETSAGSTQLNHYRHTISEAVELDSITWHVHVRDSSETDANDFDRRYYGGKVGSMGLSAEEGGLLTASWDGINFLGMKHNQKLSGNHAASPANITVPFFTPMQPIRNADIVQAGQVDEHDTVAAAHQQPYYFSQGQVKLFGTVIARIRSFSLSISNNEEPRYYLKRTMGNHRGPSEIMEQRREYSLAVSLAVPDAAASATSNSATVFKELLMEGDFGNGMQGFNVELRFDRNQNNQVNDSIIIRIPDDYTGTAGTGAAIGGNQQGAFIRSAPHNITDANPMEVEADILFRNLTIEVRDNIPIYP